MNGGGAWMNLPDAGSTGSSEKLRRSEPSRSAERVASNR